MSIALARAAKLAEGDVEVVALGENRDMALAVVLLHRDAILVLEDRGQDEPVVLYVLREVVLLVQAVVARGPHLHVAPLSATSKEAENRMSIL